MSREQYFYGVLDSDKSKDVIRDITNYGEARFTIQNEEGIQVTLVVSMNLKGDFTLTIEDEYRQSHYHTDGNAFQALIEGESA